MAQEDKSSCRDKRSLGHMGKEQATEAEQLENFNLTDIVTPVNTLEYEQLLKETNYCPNETEFLVTSFQRGFPINYRGPRDRKDMSKNIPFTVGDKHVMWGHLMKEVKAGRYAGPFNTVPFEHFIQSPIGLVPKAGGKTRLIFHLSYKFKNGNESVNYWTPEELCSVKYNDLDQTVMNALHFISQGASRIYLAKTNLMAAFRGLPILPGDWNLLVMKAENRVSGKIVYFVDKCLPFGSSISCAHFQRFSNSLKHIVSVKTATLFALTNYLDDFLLMAFTINECNELVTVFLDVCKTINFPVALEKMFWACLRLVFLGVLLDGSLFRLCVPEEKRIHALKMIQEIVSKKKATVKQLQRLTGTLNFLCKVLHPGHTFTRHMYAKYSQPRDKRGNPLKHFHHVKIDEEFKNDCLRWKMFLENSESRVLTWPFIDFEGSDSFEATQLMFFTDASLNKDLGFGCYFKPCWTFGRWPPGFVQDADPSIRYLELYALCVGIFTWQKRLNNMRVVIFCDNESVVHMVNKGTSSCKNCMYLFRLLTLNNLLHNRRIFVKHVTSKNNFLADYLSRMKIQKFFDTAPADTLPEPDDLPKL